MFSCPNVYYISHLAKMSRASLFAGIFSLAVCIYVWVVIAFFLTKNQFNPIQDALDDFFPKLEVFLQNNDTFQGEKFNETTEDLRNYVKSIRAFYPDVITATLVISVIYALSTILMMITTEFQLGCALIIPYMVLQLFFIIIMVNISFFQSLTLILMHSSASLLGTFIMFILTFLAGMVLIYLGIMNSSYWMFPCSTLLQSINFIQAYSSVVLNSIVSLHTPFTVCLLLVWKAFVSIEMQHKNTK